MKNRLLSIIVLAAITGLLWGNTRVEAGDAAVIMSRRIIPFDTALRGFQSVMRETCRVYNLDKMDKRKITRNIISDIPTKIILAIGSDALRFAQKNFPRHPIVFTMVTNPSRIVKNRQNISGVMMETPWEITFQYFKKITSKHRQVGIILNTKKMEKDIDYIKAMAAKNELEPVLRTVDNVSQAISEFKNIEDRIEAFIMVPDPDIFTPKFYEYILLASLRYRFVLIGLSPKYTKAGSLFSLIGDNRDWGVQAGLMVNKILSGTSPGVIPYGYAQKYSLSLNMKTAERIGLKIPLSIKQRADKILP